MWYDLIPLLFYRLRMLRAVKQLNAEALKYSKLIETMTEVCTGEFAEIELGIDLVNGIINGTRSWDMDLGVLQGMMNETRGREL